MGKIEIKDVERLNVRPGDMLVVTGPRDLSAQDADYIKKLFRERLPEGVEITVKSAEYDLQVVRRIDA